MSFEEKLQGELVDIVQWIDNTNNTLVYRFERYHNQIKYGARLTVREGQAAVFVNEGQIADVFEPGMYTLHTKNLPILSTLMGWKFGFESPFVAEVYFCSTRQFIDLKWGTSNPVIMRDSEFGAVRLRAFGTYAIRVKDPKVLIRQIVGTDGRFTIEDIGSQLRDLIVSRFADAVGQSKIPLLDMAANYGAFGNLVAERIGPEFESYGIELTKMLVENISVPAEVEQALDKRASIGAIGNLAAYTQFNVANSVDDAAKNPGGTAAAGVGFGFGMTMASTIGKNLASDTPPPVPGAPAFFAVIDGKQSGPFDQQALAAHVSDRKLTAQTLVWTHGMPNWLPASQVPGLAAILGDVPPPIPGA